ncbi:MAG TPA: ATP-binding protein [Acidimicrobiales bacterium]|nr:ATP-binding protein [Acidimicrobiales bacterium]
MAMVLVVDRHLLVRPWLAYGLVALALVVTVVLTVELRADAAKLLQPPAVVGELVVACAVFVLGGLAYESGGGFASSQSLGVAWPVASVLTAAVAWGPLAGLLSGVLVGLARVGGAVLNGVALAFDSHDAVALLTPLVIFAIAGGTLGYLARLLRRAESDVAAAKAREEVARTLHDGVLQTLALVERRTDDPDLARLAREQELDLRAFLAGPPAGTRRGAAQPVNGRGAPGDLLSQLRSAGATYERAYGGRVDLVLADDLPALDPAVARALAGAVSEALTNAGKHGGADRVTVFVEPDGHERPRRPGRRAGHVFCSVKDDGRGFDPAAVAEGMGLSRSVRGRIEEVGGRVELVAREGAGTEVRLWV